MKFEDLPPISTILLSHNHYDHCDIGTLRRLRKRSDFLAVRRGEKRRGRLFLLELLDRGDDAPPRVGFTVTKKTGNAVKRNRIRRRLREAMRVHAAGDMAAGNDYVIVGREEVLSALSAN